MHPLVVLGKLFTAEHAAGHSGDYLSDAVDDVDFGPVYASSELSNLRALPGVLTIAIWKCRFESVLDLVLYVWHDIRWATLVRLVASDPAHGLTKVRIQLSSDCARMQC